MFATKSCFPSGETWMPPGYQAVGIRPAILLDWFLTLVFRSEAFAPRRTTAIQLLVPLATYSVSPSGLNAKALDPLPNGNLPTGRQEMVSTTSSELVSITET